MLPKIKIKNKIKRLQSDDKCVLTYECKIYPCQGYHNMIKHERRNAESVYDIITIFYQK